jgi:hypothetical protein
MKLKLDENLGARGANLFSQAGHDVKTVSEQAMNSAPDEQFVSRRRSLPGHNGPGLQQSAAFPAGSFSGVAVLRVPSPLTMSDLLHCCRTLIAGLSQDSIVGKHSPPPC